MQAAVALLQRFVVPCADDKPSCALLIGSRAEGNAKQDSDWDVLIEAVRQKRGDWDTDMHTRGLA